MFVFVNVRSIGEQGRAMLFRECQILTRVPTLQEGTSGTSIRLVEPSHNYAWG